MKKVFISALLAGMMSLPAIADNEPQTLTANLDKCEATFYGQKWGKAHGGKVIACQKGLLKIEQNYGELFILLDENKSPILWQYTSGSGPQFNEQWKRGEW